MSIGPVAATGALAPTNPFESHLRQQDADDFGVMIGQGEGMVKGFQADIGAAGDAIYQVSRAPTVENFLSMQNTMMNVQVEFDLGVKLAGQVEQDINKLTSLQ
jgi:type III secretion system YscI/HrpB-like protein